MSEIKKIPINRIFISSDNPRREFDVQALKELADSIRTHGLLQPIMVRPKDGNYELIIGERRLKACKMLGLKEIDARIEAIDDSRAMEMRLIENTHRTDLIDAEKGDAVYLLLERFPEKYPTIQDLAQAIGKPIGTVTAWTRKSERMADDVRELVGAHKITEKAANYLLKYDPKTQSRLANMAANYPLRERQAIKFFNLYASNPKANISKLAQEAQGLERVEVDLSKLSPKGRKEVKVYLEKREKEALERSAVARKEAAKHAKAIPRKKIWKTADQTLNPKLARLSQKLGELEPQERQEVTEAIGRRIDSISQSISKENLEWMRKWETEIAPKIEKETPEHWARILEDTIYGIWNQIFVEYPESVRQTGQKRLANSLSLERLERLKSAIGTTVRELNEFRSIIDSEIQTKAHRKS